MTERTITVGGAARTVRVEGEDGAPAALVLAGPVLGGERAPDIAVITARLVSSGLQTFVLDSEGSGGPIPGHDEIVALIDGLGLTWVNLVGIGGGARPAWEVAARHFGKASSLVALDHGHPAVEGPGGPPDTGCPAVEVATTLVLVDAAYRESAYATGRYVYADYRVVELTQSEESGSGTPSRRERAAAERHADTLAAALASEIVLRSSPW